MNLIHKYGNFISGAMGNAQPVLNATIGTEATILYGRDRHPAKVTEIVYNKSGKVKGYMLQRFNWVVDMETEGYAKEIDWNDPVSTPKLHKVVTHGKRKGTVVDAYIGDADPFYDRSF